MLENITKIVNNFKVGRKLRNDQVIYSVVKISVITLPFINGLKEEPKKSDNWAIDYCYTLWHSSLIIWYMIKSLHFINSICHLE